MKQSSREATVTLATTSQVVSESNIGNSRRIVLSITNTSTGGEIVNLAWGEEAAAGKGVHLIQGANWTEAASQGFILNQERISARGSAATAKISIHEIVQED
jgi:hypothetical protein